MGFTAAICFVGLFVGLSAFMCNDIFGCGNKVFEQNSKEHERNLYLWRLPQGPSELKVRRGDRRNSPRRLTGDLAGNRIMKSDTEPWSVPVTAESLTVPATPKPQPGFVMNPDIESVSVTSESVTAATTPKPQPGFGLNPDIESVSVTAKSVTVSTTPKPQPVFIKDADIEKFTKKLWKLPMDNFASYITVNLGQQNASDTVTNVQPLLEVDPMVMESTIINNVRALYKSYKMDITVNDTRDIKTSEKENMLIDNLMVQPVIANMMYFLKSNGFVGRGMGRKMLKQIWFSRYSRRGSGGIKSSSGFQNVFHAELRPGQNEAITGLNNWIFFYDKEITGYLVYKGYSKNIPLGNERSILKYTATFVRDDGAKINIPEGVMFIGTPPEVEIALYTLCFFVRPDGKCPVYLSGKKLNIITASVTRNGRKMIRSAYPEVV